MSHSEEIKQGNRFEFGKNWENFLKVLDEDRVNEAKKSLQKMLNVENLYDCNFVDVGSGSGLFSLAAYLLGANVFSFDFDPNSVSCTRELRNRYCTDVKKWEIDEGSVLDIDYINKIGKFNIVYSWGVLHHTGQMNLGLDNVSQLVKPKGKIFIAIYNDQGKISKVWRNVKKIYCSSYIGSFLMKLIFYPYFAIRIFISDLMNFRNPFTSYSKYKQTRGMSLIHDWKDWLGGYPFEVAKPELICEKFIHKGFNLEKLNTCGGSLGCNEYVFRSN